MHSHAKMKLSVKHLHGISLQILWLVLCTWVCICQVLLMLLLVMLANDLFSYDVPIESVILQPLKRPFVPYTWLKGLKLSVLIEGAK